MHIKAIIGSFRPNSIHRKIFNHYQEICKSSFELTEVKIDQLPIFAGQSIDDIIVPLANEIQSSDGIIFFAPEYNYSIPGGLKNAIDWFSRVDPQPFAKKPATIIGASPGNVGTARMQYHLRQVGVFLDLLFMNKPEVMISKAMDKLDDNGISDQRTVEFLEKHAEKFKDFVQSVRA